MAQQNTASTDPEGGGARGPDPPGKTQVIWDSIGNKQLDPSWYKCWSPSGTSENYNFLLNKPLVFCKISGVLLKKELKKRCQGFL